MLLYFMLNLHVYSMILDYESVSLSVRRHKQHVRMLGLSTILLTYLLYPLYCIIILSYSPILSSLLHYG